MRRLPHCYKDLRGEKQAIDRGLAAVIELGGAVGFLADWVVDVAEGLLEQDGASPFPIPVDEGGIIGWWKDRGKLG
jgi:hypothetical protein